ncbi:MAG: four helix bundle protein [Flavobacterium sp.]
MKEFSFEKLEVWQGTKTFTVFLYRLMKAFPEDEKFGLVQQINRTVISVSSNLAEGSGRTSKKDQAHFYQMAYSSLMEVLSQVLISIELGYIAPENELEIRNQIVKISNKINSLRKNYYHLFNLYF